MVLFYLGLTVYKVSETPNQWGILCQLLVYFTNLQPEWSKICLTFWFTEIFNTRTHQIFNMNIKINWKKMTTKTFFLGVLFHAVMTLPDIWEESTFPQLCCITEYGIGGWWIWKERMCCLHSNIARKFGHSGLRNYLRYIWTRFCHLARKVVLSTLKSCCLH